MFDALTDEVLQKAIDGGIIDVTTLKMQIEMSEKKKILSEHQSKIWQGKDGKWFTYVTANNEKGRRLIHRKTREDLDDAIVQNVKSLENEPTVKDTFNRWLDNKMEYGEIQKQTYDRYVADYQRYFKGQPIENKKIKNISELDLEDFIRRTIHEKQLTSKSWSNLRLLINGIWKFAKKRKYIDMSITNFMGDLDLSDKIFRKKLKYDEEQVFTNDEVALIEDYITHKETSIINLGILLAFRTGLRVGELSSLKKTDIKGNQLYVRRTEINYIDGDERIYSVRESTKGRDGERVVILTDDALEILNLICKMSNDEFLFVMDGERIKGKAFSTKLRRICGYVGVTKRSMHKIRKTYATNLLNAGVDEKIIQKQMGHTDIATTKGYYYYNNRNVDETKRILAHATNF